MDPFLRDFPSRALLALLSNPELFRALLAIVDLEIARRIDIASLTRVERSFVDEEYRRREADLLYRASFVDEDAKAVWIYCILEHQSGIDPWMPQRFFHYVGRIWEEERREWERAGRDRGESGVSFVLPVLFYTGEEPWPGAAGLAPLIHGPRLLESLKPSLPLLVLDLKRAAPERFARSGHPLGSVLAAFARERAPAEDLLDRLESAAADLSNLPPERRAAGLDLVRFLLAFIFQRRPGDEHRVLLDAVRCRLKPYERREVDSMQRSYAEELIEKGIEKGIERGVLRGKQESLLRLVELKFGRIEPSTEQKVRSTSDAALLDMWIERILTASTLAELGVEP